MSKQDKTVKTKPAKKTAAKAPKKARAAKLSSDVAESKLAALVALVKSKGGLASSEIANAIGVTQIQVRRLAEKAIASGDVFRGGKLRFTRYAASQADADSASESARARGLFAD